MLCPCLGFAAVHGAASGIEDLFLIPGILPHPRDLPPSHGSVTILGIHPHSRDLPPPQGSVPNPGICSPPQASVPTPRICPHLRDLFPSQGSVSTPGIRPHPRDLPHIPGGLAGPSGGAVGWENLGGGALGMRPSRFSQLLTHRRSAGPSPNHQDKQGPVS